MDGTIDRLQPHHREALEKGSGISPFVIERRGYRSLVITDMFQRMARGEISQAFSDAGGWMAIPIHRPDGTYYGDAIRLDNAADVDGHDQKYIWPIGAHNVVDIHPYCLEQGWHRQSDIPLIITEGVKKADAILSWVIKLGLKYCVVAINGCWGWRARPGGKGQGAVALPDWFDIALDNREIILIPDSDFHTNPSVAQGWLELARYMVGKTRSKEHHVLIACPNSLGLRKVGADDYLLTHSLDELLGLARHPKSIDLDPIAPELNILSLPQLWELAKNQPEWMVRNLIGLKSINVFTGHSRSLKTWHVLSLGLDMCLGQPWLGHGLFEPVRPLKVLMLTEELSGEEVSQRVLKMMLSERYVGKEKEKQIIENFSVLAHSGLTIGSQELFDALVLQIQMRKTDVLICDSLSMLWDGNENDASEVKGMYRWLQQLAEATGVAIILIHHLTKPVQANASRESIFDIRGSGQLVNQAHSIVRFDNYAAFSPRNRQVQIQHLKAWKGTEPESWVSRFIESEEPKLVITAPDGDRQFPSIGLTFDSLMTENNAHAYAASQDDDAGMEWLMEVLEGFPGLHTEGVTAERIMGVIMGYWPKSQGKAPSNTTVQDWLRNLVRQDRIGRVRIRESGAVVYALPGAPVILSVTAAAVEDDDALDQA